MNAYVLSVITSVAISMLGVLAVYIVTGIGGMFSMGSASFMLIGAYVSGMLCVKFGLGLGFGIVIGISVGMLFALVVGIPTVKLRMDYVALITFGFGEAIVAFINNTTNLTGGSQGLSGITKETTAVIALVTLGIAIFVTYSYSKSKYGRQSTAIKNNSLAASAMGVNVNTTKLLAFVISGGIASLAGVLYVYNTTFVDPSGFGWLTTADWIIIVFVGGMDSLTGAIFAGALLCGLPEILRAAGEWRIIIYCIVVLFIVNFRPQGIFGKKEFSIKGIVNWMNKRIACSNSGGSGKGCR